MSKEFLLESINRMISNFSTHHLRKVYYLLLGFTSAIPDGGEENAK